MEQPVCTSANTLSFRRSESSAHVLSRIEGPNPGTPPSLPHLTKCCLPKRTLFKMQGCSQDKAGAPLWFTLPARATHTGRELQLRGTWRPRHLTALPDLPRKFNITVNIQYRAPPVCMGGSCFPKAGRTCLALRGAYALPRSRVRTHKADGSRTRFRRWQT